MGDTATRPTTRAARGRRAPRQREEAEEAAAFPRPWATDADLDDWEFDGTSEDRPRRPPRASVVVELDPEQTAWVGQQADRVGLTLSEFIKKLIDEARASP